MAVETKKVTGRREISYRSYDELLADAQSVAASDNVKMVGNWSLAQIFQHLAAALESSIDGVAFKAPWPMRVMGKLFMKKRMLTNTLPAGFKIPDGQKAEIFRPDSSVDTATALAKLSGAIERVKTENARAEHPFFDTLTRQEWDAFNLRHAELHMSFAIPPAS
ncbi:MAG TPA: DUF1569 domain-containing protein [Pirellulales bacterium]|nr:DUF1569 domain-containing protein [Pirellulales bacterium]